MERPIVRFKDTERVAIQGADVLVIIDPMGHFTHLHAEQIMHNADAFIMSALSNGVNGSLLDRVAKGYAFFTGWNTSDLEAAEDGGWDYTGDPRQYPLLTVVSEFTDEFLHLMNADIVIGWDTKEKRLVESRFD